ncbi:MAG: hypothetical protein OER95_14025, partial [Acidimicrobiia bacterium]|nr:hypothetical protein [Acidimicrobiia bacterium]
RDSGSSSEPAPKNPTSRPDPDPNNHVAAMEQGTPSGSQEPEEVAEVIFTAATDGTPQIRYISGEGAKALLANRYSAEQDEEFVAGMRAGFGL